VKNSILRLFARDCHFFTSSGRFFQLFFILRNTGHKASDGHAVVWVVTLAKWVVIIMALELSRVAVIFVLVERRSPTKL
jgi:hypothetical protein